MPAGDVTWQRRRGARAGRLPAARPQAGRCWLGRPREATGARARPRPN